MRIIKHDPTMIFINDGDGLLHAASITGAPAGYIIADSRLIGYYRGNIVSGRVSIHDTYHPFCVFSSRLLRR